MKTSFDGLSIFEIRRRAPLHFQARSENARFSAYVLENMDDRQHHAAAALGYSGDPNIALHEAFIRESAVALELMLKALVAVRIERGIDLVTHSVPMTHDVVRLWRLGDFPKLVKEDLHRLHIYKSILYWSGRYQAPRNDEDFYHEQRAMEHLKDKRPAGAINIEYPRAIHWADFDRIYQVPHGEFWKIYPR